MLSSQFEKYMSYADADKMIDIFTQPPTGGSTIVSFVGPSRSGKTTLVNIMKREFGNYSNVPRDDSGDAYIYFHDQKVYIFMEYGLTNYCQQIDQRHETVKFINKF